MSKVLDETSENNNELNEVKNPKNLCVHDLKKKLRENKKDNLLKCNYFICYIIFFGVISLLIYQSL